MEPGGHSALGSFAGWSIVSVVAHALDYAEPRSLLLTFDDPGLPGAGATLSAALAGASPAVRARWVDARGRSGGGHIAISGTSGWFDSLVAIPVQPPGLSNAPLVDARKLNVGSIVVAASDALARNVPAESLFEWLKAGLRGGRGQVILAVDTPLAQSQLTAAAIVVHAQSSVPAPGERAGSAGRVLRTVPGLSGVGAALQVASALQRRGPPAPATALAGALVAGAGLATAAWLSSRGKPAAAGAAHGIGTFTPSGETPVSRLASLLLAELKPRQRDALIEKASRPGVRGEPMARVEEWLYEQGDPAKVLAGMFAPFELDLIMRRRFGPAPTGLPDGRDLARQILAKLGFSSRGEARGLHPALQRAKALRTALEQDRVTPQGLGGELGGLLEQVGKSLLTFHLRVAVGSTEAAEELLSEIGHDPQRWSEMTLGGIGKSLSFFDRWRHGAPENPARAHHRGLFGERELGGRRFRSFAASRNKLVHHREAREDLSRVARQLAEDAVEWLLGLRAESEGPRLFPAVVRVESVEHDAHGSLLTRARDDEGKAEQLRTDDQKDIGTSWYMVPRSNPVRVRPLLVSAD